MITWYEHARAYAEAKWAGMALVSRWPVAEALVTVTIALTTKEKCAPELRVLQQALFAWAFNPATRKQVPPREAAAALGWGARASLHVRRWTTRPRYGLRSARVPAAWSASQPPGQPSGANGRCSTTPSATPSSRATSPPTPSIAFQWTTPPSPRASTGASSSAPHRPGTAGRRPGTQ
jgi:hypothetical protein